MGWVGLIDDEDEKEDEDEDGIMGRLLTPVESAVVIVAAAFVVFSRVTSGFHYVDFATARPFAVDGVFGHHP